MNTVFSQRELTSIEINLIDEALTIIITFQAFTWPRKINFNTMATSETGGQKKIYT